LSLLFVPFLCLLQIDRLYDWKKSPDTDVVATLKKQKKNTKDEFDERAKAVIVEFAQQVTNYMNNGGGKSFVVDSTIHYCDAPIV
jgi:hypothetical protein